jgi:cell division GTPase FtsZ
MNNRQLKIWGGRFQILNNVFVRGVGGGGNNIIITLHYESDTAYVANNIVYKNGILAIHRLTAEGTPGLSTT